MAKFGESDKINPVTGEPFRTMLLSENDLKAIRNYTSYGKSPTGGYSIFPSGSNLIKKNPQDIRWVENGIHRDRWETIRKYLDEIELDQIQEIADFIDEGFKYQRDLQNLPEIFYKRIQKEKAAAARIERRKEMLDTSSNKELLIGSAKIKKQKDITRSNSRYYERGGGKTNALSPAAVDLLNMALNSNINFHAEKKLQEYRSEIKRSAIGSVDDYKDSKQIKNI